MEENKANMYFMQYKDMVPKESQIVLKNALTSASDSVENNLAMVSIKNPILVLIMSIFFGTFGIDRFMIGDIGLGVTKLLFGWLTFGIWPLVDIFFSYKKAKKINLENIMLNL